MVYIVEQPARGRSAHHRSIMGETLHFTAEGNEETLTNTKEQGFWESAKHHTQWPGEGKRGDLYFNQFVASQVESLAGNAKVQTYVKKAGTALLEVIGPSLILAHSQAGAFAWVLGDSRPDLVKGIVVLDPLGPPKQRAIIGSSPARVWGVTDIPLTYDPPVERLEDLVFEKRKSKWIHVPDSWLQKEPARKLIHLQNIPILILTAQASYHSHYDIWTSLYLEQAGVPNTYVRLEDIGILGNGHMMMLEKNSDEIAAYIDKWLENNVQ